MYINCWPSDENYFLAHVVNIHKSRDTTLFSSLVFSQDKSRNPSIIGITIKKKLNIKPLKSMKTNKTAANKKRKQYAHVEGRLGWK